MADPHLEFVNFIIKIAANRTRLSAFLNDPAGVARQEGLTEVQVEAIVNGGEAVLNEMVKTDLSNWLLATFQGAPFVGTETGKKKGARKTGGKAKAAKKSGRK